MSKPKWTVMKISYDFVAVYIHQSPLRLRPIAINCLLGTLEQLKKVHILLFILYVRSVNPRHQIITVFHKCSLRFQRWIANYFFGTSVLSKRVHFMLYFLCSFSLSLILFYFILFTYFFFTICICNRMGPRAITD